MRRTSILAGSMILALCVSLTTLATSPVSVDFDAALTGAGQNPATYNANGNSMLDSDELALLSLILGNTSKPSHNAIHAAWNQNLAQMTTDLGPFAPVYATPLAGYMTLGDSASVAFVVALAASVTITVTPANYDLSQSVVLADSADPDADSLTNQVEYTAIPGSGGPSSAKRAQYLVDALTPNVLAISTQPVGGSVAVGGSWTFTVAASGGTPPYHYQWKQDGGNVGTDSASYAIGSATLGDAGSYTCDVSDSAGPPATVTSNAAVLSVVAGVPATTVAGLLALLLLCAGTGVFALRRVAHR